MTRHIEAAAIKSNGTIYTLPRPNRHHNIFQKQFFAGNPINRGEVIQGFLTSDGRFVNRIQGGAIATKSGQIERLNHPPNLYSEDLW